jgi:membrane-bound ClpP family serine protease
MSTRCDRVQSGTGWVMCLVTLIAALYVALEDMTNLLTIVPFLGVVAFILGRATLSNGFTAPLAGIQHGRLISEHRAAHDSFEIILARINPEEFYPYWHDRLPGRL